MCHFRPHAMQQNNIVKNNIVKNNIVIRPPHRRAGNKGISPLPVALLERR
jgi:hypothetical protein